MHVQYVNYSNSSATTVYYVDVYEVLQFFVKLLFLMKYTFILANV